MHCQICLHEAPGHEPNCPVATGEPQVGVSQQPSLQSQGVLYDQVQAQAYEMGRGGLTGSSWFIAENNRLRALCVRAADALEEEFGSPTDPAYGVKGPIHELIAELRKAAK